MTEDESSIDDDREFGGGDPPDSTVLKRRGIESLDRSVSVFMEYDGVEIITPEGEREFGVEVELEVVNSTITQNSMAQYVQGFKEVVISHEDLVVKMVRDITDAIEADRVFVSITSDKSHQMKEVCGGKL